jgi:hypothetical protein
MMSAEMTAGSGAAGSALQIGPSGRRPRQDTREIRPQGRDDSNHFCWSAIVSKKWSLIFICRVKPEGMLSGIAFSAW